MSIQILNATNLQLATCRQPPTNKLTLEDGHGDLVGHLGLGGVPLGVGPALQHLGGDGVAPLVQLLHVVEGIEHQQSVLELISRQLGQGGVGIAQEGDEGGHIVPTLHGPEQFNGAGAGDEGGGFVAQGQGGQVRGLGVGRLVDSGGDAVGEEIDELRAFVVVVGWMDGWMDGCVRAQLWEEEQRGKERKG